MLRCGCEDSWKPPESDCGGRNFSDEIFHKKVLVLSVYHGGCHNEGLLAPARGQCQVSSWPLSGHSSSDSGSSKAINEQMIPLRSLQGQQIQALTINIQVICVVYFSNKN